MKNKEQNLNEAPTGNIIKVDVSSSVDDYGTDNYCTCEKHNYEEHICPFKEEIYNDIEILCTCCPYCEHQCCMDI